MKAKATLSSGRFNRTDALLLALIGIVALASSLPFSYAAQGQMPEAGDLTIHWPRMLAFDEALRSGVWLPRWLGSMNDGYGAATTLFYAPLLYYALSAAHALTGDWPKAVEVVVAFAALGSGVSLYAAARALVSRGASASAAIFYVLAPYHLIDLYHRGALAELLAFVWMPLVILAYTRATRRFSAQAIAGGALALALLVVTHPPTAYLFTLAFLIFVTFYAGRTKSWQCLASGLAMVALGAAVAAFYAMPAVIEKPLVSQSVTDLFHRHVGFINELLVGNRFEQLIAAIAVTMALQMVALSWPWRRQPPVADDIVTQQHFAAWKLVGALALVLLLPVVRPLVGVLPGMAAVAFVWRALAIALLAAAMLVAIAIDRLLVSRLKVWASMVTLLIVGNIVFGVVASARAGNLRIAFVAPAERYEQDFTPAGTPSVYELPRGKTCEFVHALPGDEARLLEWQPERRVIETTAAAGGMLQVYSLMYPGWMATVDGSPVMIETDPQLKTMLIPVPPGKRQIVLVFQNTKLRLLANCISLAALVVLIALLLVKRRRVEGDGLRLTGYAA